MSKEKRVIDRLEPCELTTISVHDSVLPPAYGVLSNISELGLCLETDSLFTPGQDVKLLICLNRLSVLVGVDSRIIWASSEGRVIGGYVGSFLVGAKFIWMPESDRRCLRWSLESPDFKAEPFLGTVYTPAPRSVSNFIPEPEQMQEPIRSPKVEPIRTSLPEQLWEVSSAPSEGGARNGTYRGIVLIVRQGIKCVDRICRLVNAAGLNAVLTNSPETVVSKVRVFKPALVLFSQHVGRPGVDETARRIKTSSSCPDTPIAVLTDHYTKPYLLDYSYPVEACLPIDGDETAMIQNIRLLSHTGKRHHEKKLGALEGNFERNSLCEVLYYLSAAQKTGCVTVQAGRRKGKVYMDRGDLVHARLGPVVGMDACVSIVCYLQEGYFKFESDVRPNRTTMRERGVEAILNAAKEFDEQNSRESEGSSDFGSKVG
jgi:hypothetical protein